MATLHLGVIDVPYGHEDPARPSRKAATTPNETTGDVAQILEDKYGVIALFWELHGQEVADAMAADFMAGLETAQIAAQSGASLVGMYPLASSMDLAKTLFSRFLESKEMDGVVGGVPTKASLEGTSHRFKNKKGAPGRPSFVDTGLFEASFKAWMEGRD